MAKHTPYTPFGMHMPNIDAFYEIETRLLPMGIGAATFLDVATGGEGPADDPRSWLEYCLDSGLLVHVRFYDADWTTLEPKAWATKCFDWLVAKGLAGRDNLIVTLANEQGTEPPGRPPPDRARYDLIREWNRGTLVGWREREGATGLKTKLFAPPLAFGHEPPGYPPDAEYAIVKPAWEQFDGLTSHPMWFPDGKGLYTDSEWYAFRDYRPGDPDMEEEAAFLSEQLGRGLGHGEPVGDILRQLGSHTWGILGGMAVQIPGLPIAHTECTNHMHSNANKGGTTAKQYQDFIERLVTQYPRAIMVTPFIWGGSEDHKGHFLYQNTPFIDAMTAWKKPMRDWPWDGNEPPPPTPPGNSWSKHTAKLLRFLGPWLTEAADILDPPSA